MAAAVPGADGLAGHVVEHPARAGFHAELVDAVAEHVVGVAHDDAAERIAGLLTIGVAHGALVAFDVELDAGGEAVLGAVEVVAGADDAVARDGQEGRPSASKCAVVGVSAWAAARCGGVALVRRRARRRCAAHARSARSATAGVLKYSAT